MIAVRWEREVQRLVIADRLSGRVQGLCVGMEVQTTGRGRTTRWKGYRGTISGIEGEQIRVEFDAGIAEQVLSADELQPRLHAGCPCSQCTWEFQHHP